MSAAELKARLRGDLTAAMRERAADDVRVLRTLIAALDNAEAAPGEDKYVPRAFGDPGSEVARLELDAAAIATLLGHEIEARQTAAAEYRQRGRDEQAASLLTEIALIRRYL